jgi:hypothetical protein
VNVSRLLVQRCTVAVMVLSGLLLPAAAAHGFVCLKINGHCTRWTQGGATLRSFLGTPPSALINGTFTWDQNAINAANDWNAAGAAFHFDVSVGGTFNNPCGAPGAGHACPNTGPVGDNPVFFADSFCGQDFGDIIELTNNCASSSTGAMLNAPVFVNSTVLWNAYDGPIRVGPNNVVVNDIRRVLVHEFGHVLGLDHPDMNQQSVFAIMNSRESNIDRIQSDDIAGLFSLYPNAGAPSGSSGSANSGCQIAGSGAPMGGWVAVVPLLLLLRVRRRNRP